MSKKEKKILVDQQFALDTYLDSLLAEATEPEVEVKEAVVVDLHPAPVEVQKVQVTREAQVEVADDASAAMGTGVPAWAKERFQCLIFSVSGLKLAVPLVRLNGILTWSGDISPMPGHSDHFLGLLNNHGDNVKIIDPAMLVMPEDRVPPPVGEEGRAVPGSIILIDDKRWGLACDFVSETVELQPEEIKWRSARGKRLWLAGTVIDHMCALIDVDEFARILERAEDAFA
jgi:purine-binding chemotaxis protein CheW